jgi:lipopolysaccharide export system protein LptA
MGLLAGAGLLLLVIAGFLTYAHYRTHRFLKELPRKLGADIRQETNSFTWSQTVKGKTIFTVHAAKAIQHKNGKYAMNDVGIVIYGKGEGQASRVDRISGNEFELDQAEGIVRAMGEVHLDLQAPAAADSAVQPTASAPMHDEDLRSAKLIHVKTSNLVYQQKQGVATTDQEIEFEYNGLTGHATGADYSADTGVLLLHSAVKVSGLNNGKPILLTATHGELDRRDRRITLAQARFVTTNRENSDPASRQTVEAKQATAFLRTDGSVEKISGEAVTLTSGDGSRIASQRGEMLLTAASKPASMWMGGDVRYSFKEPGRDARGEASTMRASFDPQGHPAKVILQGGVHLLEHAVPAKNSQPGTERELTAAKVELEMATEPGKRSWLRKATATGNARLRTSEPEKESAGIRQSTIRGDFLTAQFVSQGGKENLASIHGQGSPSLEQRRPDGSVQTSSADILDATFHRAGIDQAVETSYSGGREMLDTAFLSGHVIITGVPGGKHQANGSASGDRAIAQKASYDARTGRVLLTGAVELSDQQSVLWADRVNVNQQTGDASAAGKVKANFQQSPSSDPVHVLADHADLKKSNGTAIFYGAAHPARLWEGASQIEAPVLQFDRARQRLIARGTRSATGATVQTVLVSSGDRNRHREPAVIRITSQEMDYSNEKHTADFTGGVKVDSTDGTMHGKQAIAYFSSSLQATQNSKPTQNPSFLQSGVDRVVVNGDIVIRQRGREATGNKLFYTANDGTFVLTGTEQNPPKVMDTLRGTISGRELRFREQDASVVISNGDANETGPRVRTETRVKKEP